MEEYRVNFPKLPPEIIEGEPEWEVEAILRHHYFGRNKQLQY
jgi:hypothetical protein